MNPIGLVMLSLLLTNSCNAQTTQPKIPRTENSKNKNVRCGIQEKSGDMWFGTTANGIYRYNGKAFINYTDKDGIGSNRIFELLQDNDGFIWIGTDAGLTRYNPGNKTFTRMVLPEIRGNNFFNASAAVAPTQVWSIMQDKNGKLWFGTYEDGVLCYDGKTFTRFLHDDGVENKSNLKLAPTVSMIEDKSGNIWFATWFEGLCRYDPSTKAITNYKPNNEVWYAGLLVDKNGNLWAGRRTKGVVHYDGTGFTNILQHGVMDSCGASPCIQDKRGDIWLASEAANMTERDVKGGVWRYNPSTKAFTNYTTADGLPDMTPMCIVEDKAGNIWVGTRNMGLCRYNPSTEKTAYKTFESFSE